MRFKKLGRNFLMPFKMCASQFRTVKVSSESIHTTKIRSEIQMAGVLP